MVDHAQPDILPVPYSANTLKVVGPDAVAAFLRSAEHTRNVIEFRLIGNTLVARSTRWKNVVYNFRNDVKQVFAAAGVATTPLFAGELTDTVITGVIACLSCWAELTSARKIELTEHHALLISHLALARLVGQEGNPQILAGVEAEFRARGWDLDAVVEELQEMHLLTMDTSRQRFVLRDRVLLIG
ncbi:hypothetical protein MQE23_25795 [Streptomyces sp. HP-A2021]|uniref:hypothetical protein n=1 Tax=Streptomyces sp. HP-A2021 TaxID=2927875 RepID=UPI001FAFFF08|nr:hypothetical protein [Streptomyces sp. HP-A2021]UOB12263.1 hypothetical protein MQE23_25795 [Streptomyces sp. HP-A2021]